MWKKQIILLFYLSLWITYFFAIHFSGGKHERTKACIQQIKEEPESIPQNCSLHFDSPQNTRKSDRALDWVAFDGGIHFDSPKFNSISGAQLSVERGARILNIDLSMTADEQLVLAHSDDSFGEIDFKGNKLTRNISDMAEDGVVQRNIPCIPEERLRSWIENSTNMTYSCLPETVASISSFLEQVKALEIIFDLKASTIELQLEQAYRVMNLNTGSSLAVRFFPVGDHKVSKSIIPEAVLQTFTTNSSMRHIRYYANSPSYLACAQLISWIKREENAIACKNIMGCFISLNNPTMDETWKIFCERHEIYSDSAPKPGHNSIYKYICDVPCKLQRPEMDVGFWRRGFIECVNSGFEYIHFPFPISPSNIESKANPATPTFPPNNNHAVDIIKFHIGNNKKRRGWRKYASIWGIGNSDNWEAIEKWPFGGNTFLGREVKTNLKKLNTIAFTCVSKVLVVMLSLRLEELGMLKIDDPITSSSDNSCKRKNNISLRTIFSNVIRHGNGTKFEYSNRPWECVPKVIEASTRKPFRTSIQDYVLKPMGLSGKFNIYTLHLPYAARGYVGGIEDLLLIGSTLTNGGISPKTKQRIISASSVARLLRTTSHFEENESDEVVHSMSKFQAANEPNLRNNKAEKFPKQPVDGYCLGLWHVSGWRHDDEGRPIEGWVSMGGSEALLYFEKTGLVVGMLAKAKLGLELTPAFAKVVRDLDYPLIGALEIN